MIFTIRICKNYFPNPTTLFDQSCIRILESCLYKQYCLIWNQVQIGMNMIPETSYTNDVEFH